MANFSDTCWVSLGDLPVSNTPLADVFQLKQLGDCEQDRWIKVRRITFCGLYNNGGLDAPIPFAQASCVRCSACIVSDSADLAPNRVNSLSTHGHWLFY